MERRGFIGMLLAAVGSLTFGLLGTSKESKASVVPAPVLGHAQKPVTAGMALPVSDVNGEGYHIEQMEGKNIAGIWLSNRQEPGTPCVSLYHDHRDGPVVGVHAKRVKGGLAACLHVDKKGNGAVQLIDADGTYVDLTAGDVKKLLALLK